MLNRSKKILKESKSHYHAAISSENQYRQKKLVPDDGDIWGEERQKIEEQIKNYKHAEDAINGIMTGIRYDGRRWVAPLARVFPFIFSHYIPLKLLKYIAPEVLFIHYYYDVISRAFPDQIDTINLLSDSKFVPPGTTLKKKDKYLSRELFYHSSSMLTCMAYGNYSTICEIGVGYGALANIWMNNPRAMPDKYILVDIPETLFQAEIYLALSNKDLNIHYISENENGAEKISGDIVLCPSHLVHMLDNINFDLIVSKGCLNELGVDWLVYHQKFIAKHPEAVFYVCQPAVGPSSGECSPISPLLPDKWVVDYVRIDSPPLIMRLNSPVLEVIFKKSNSINVNTFNFSKKLSLHDFYFYMYDYLGMVKIEDIYKFSVKAFRDLPRPPPELAYFFSKIIYLEKDCEPRYSPEARDLFSKVMDTCENMYMSEEAINKVLQL
jgi:putative sugar O-methyltransferase